MEEENRKVEGSQEKLLILGVLVSLSLIFLFDPAPQDVLVSQIDHSLIKNYIKTKGEVRSLYKSSEVTIFDLVQANESIKVVAFKRLPINEKDELEVVGQVKLYDKELEIVLEEWNEVT